MCDKCKGKTFDQIKQLHGVYRPGKTARDKASGAHAARFTNRAARQAWLNDPKAK